MHRKKLKCCIDYGFKYKLHRKNCKTFLNYNEWEWKKGIFFINTFILKYASPKIKKKNLKIFLY